VWARRAAAALAITCFVKAWRPAEQPLSWRQPWSVARGRRRARTSPLWPWRAARRRVGGGAEPARPPQVVRTTIEPAHRPRDNSYDAYEYTAHSHTYNSYEIPSAKARALPVLAARLASAALAISRPRCIHC